METFGTLYVVNGDGFFFFVVGNLDFLEEGVGEPVCTRLRFQYSHSLAAKLKSQKHEIKPLRTPYSTRENSKE
jgi:hypothetical protein